MKKGNEQSVSNRKLRRRSSSLSDMTEPGATKSTALAASPVTPLVQLKKREKDGENRSSSPDLNVVDSPAKEGKSTTLEGSSTQDEDREKGRDPSGEDDKERGGVVEGGGETLNTDRMSVSTNESATSAVSVDDDVETVIDEDEKNSPQEGRKSRGPLLSSDLEGDRDSVKFDSTSEREQLTGSCSTLENEKQEGEREVSVEPQKRHLMSLSFRQELLSVCQLKTDPKLDGEVTKLASPSLDVVQLLGRTLPHIVPHMIHNKREVRLYCCAYGLKNSHTFL